MNFRDQLEKDQAVFYNKDEFAILATLSTAQTIPFLEEEDEEFGDEEHDLFRVQASDSVFLKEGDKITLKGEIREVLSVEPIENKGLECRVVLVKNDV